MASLSAHFVSSRSFLSQSSASINGSSKASSLTMRTVPRLSSGALRRLRISCEAGAPPAKPETLQKVIEIVTRQLAAAPGTVQPHSKFQELGADSLDQVEIVMALEEEFKISVDEDGAESIATVQDAANLIEKVSAKV